MKSFKKLKLLFLHWFERALNNGVALVTVKTKGKGTYQACQDPHNKLEHNYKRLVPASDWWTGAQEMGQESPKYVSHSYSHVLNFLFDF